MSAGETPAGARGPGGGRDLDADEADLLTTTEAIGRLEEEAGNIRARLAASELQHGTPEPADLAADRRRLGDLEAAIARYRPQGA